MTEPLPEGWTTWQSKPTEPAPVPVPPLGDFDPAVPVETPPSVDDVLSE